jgi:hypothetical protein
MNNRKSCDAPTVNISFVSVPMTDMVTVKLNRELATKMVRPWYLIKKREAEIVLAAFQTALDNNEQ